MPFRRAYRKKAPAYRRKRKLVYRKRRIAKKRQNNPSKMTFKPRKQLGIAFPERYLTKVKGTLLLSNAASSGSIDYQILGNSILDFGSSLSGDNVSGFSALASVYNKAIVYGSKCTVQYANSTTTPKYVVLYPLGGLSPLPNTTRAMMDQPFAITKQVSANTGMGKAYLKQYISTKRILALKDLKDNDELFVNISGGSPTQPSRLWSWNLRIDNTTGTGTDSDLAKVQVTYYVECFDRVTLNQA